MLRLLLVLLAAIPLLTAADPWAKVRDLKNGTELRVVKRGVAQPVMARFDEATDENLVVVVKNEQIAIKKDNIERIDYRPPQTGSRIIRESRTEVKDPEPPRGALRGGTTPSSSNSSSVAIGAKPDFETIYRRTATLPQPK